MIPPERIPREPDDEDPIGGCVACFNAAAIILGVGALVYLVLRFT